MCWYTLGRTSCMGRLLVICTHQSITNYYCSLSKPKRKRIFIFLPCYNNYSTKPVTKEQFHNYRRPVTAHYMKTVIILSLLTAVLHIFDRRLYCYSITQKLKICDTGKPSSNTFVPYFRENLTEFKIWHQCKHRRIHTNLFTFVLLRES